MRWNVHVNNQSPLLDHCPPSLPATWYYDPDHHREELRRIHARNWIHIGRVEEFPAMTVRRIEVAGQNLIAVNDPAGGIACFHNTCRHRGAELCAAPETRLKSKLITCPYHEWSYGLDGRLVRVPYATPTADFRKEDHGLLPVHVKQWNGFVFVCLADDPPPFDAAPDLGAHALDNWPMARTGDRPHHGSRNRLQLENLLGKLQRVPALPRHSSRALRHGAGLQARHHGRQRGGGLEAGHALRHRSQTRRLDLEHERPNPAAPNSPTSHQPNAPAATPS